MTDDITLEAFVRNFYEGLNELGLTKSQLNEIMLLLQSRAQKVYALSERGLKQADKLFGEDLDVTGIYSMIEAALTLSAKQAGSLLDTILDLTQEASGEAVNNATYPQTSKALLSRLTPI